MSPLTRKELMRLTEQLHRIDHRIILVCREMAMFKRALARLVRDEKPRIVETHKSHEEEKNQDKARKKT